MVFEHFGKEYTIYFSNTNRCYYLRCDRDEYGCARAIKDIFRGQQETFKLVSIPVEIGKFYEPGDRFFESEDGVEYILVSLLGVRALVSMEDGCNYDEPTITVSGIFGGDEKNFSLLV